MLAQPLEVGDQVGRGVGRQVDGGRPRVRRAAAAVALVELRPRGRRRGRTTGGSTACSPEPGPPCSTTAGLPSGLPDTSQCTRCPSPTSSMPWSYGSGQRGGVPCLKSPPTRGSVVPPTRAPVPANLRGSARTHCTKPAGSARTDCPTWRFSARTRRADLEFCARDDDTAQRARKTVVAPAYSRGPSKCGRPAASASSIVAR